MSSLQSKNTLSSLVNVSIQFKKKTVGAKNIKYLEEVSLLEMKLTNIIENIHKSDSSLKKWALYYLWKNHYLKEYYRKIRPLFATMKKVPQKPLSIVDMRNFVSEALVFGTDVEYYIVRFWCEYYKVGYREIGLSKSQIKKLIEIC